MSEPYMPCVLGALKAVLKLSRSLHNPLNHGRVSEERTCPMCKLYRRVEKAISLAEKEL